jgi:superfamily II DNA or RNA helicase
MATLDKSPETTHLPEQGQLVEVRARPWVVAEVETSTLAGPALEPGEPQHLVTLRSVEDDAEPDESLRVVWEVEPSARVLETGTFPNPSGFDDPARFDAFLDAVRWGASSQADARQLLAPFQSGVEIDAYQLEPLARALRMPRVGLLVADDVGLGKTIEAGLVTQELLLRYRARRILVATPADLQLQWRDEMRDKFGLEFWIVDTELVKGLRRSRGIHANPWECYPRLITSYDWLKRERPMRWFRETLPEGDEPRYPRRWDLLIVDEAHNLAPSGRTHYAVDSLRTETLREIVPHFEHRLFLTATPHNGYDESFSALLELLDDQRFARAVVPTNAQLRPAMVRRLKKDITDWDGKPRFPERILEAVEVDYAEGERCAHADLRAYTDLRTKRAAGDVAGEFATQFVCLLLKKRLFSSPAAFLRTVRTHRDTLHRHREQPRQSLVALQQQFERAGELQETDDALEQALDDAQAAAAASLEALDAAEDKLLASLETWAESAVDRADAKASRLIELVEDVCRPGGTWTDDRIIVFTEYRDTQNWLLELLAARGLTDNDRTLTLYGGQPDDERAEIKAAFQAKPSEAPVRILLATDSASEGINLQNHCHRLLHYEIPWNPNRMEQRNGRVDRHGQRAPQVLVFHFAPAGFQTRYPDPENIPVGSLDGDYEFLRRAVVKIDRIRNMLGEVGPVIAEQVTQAMSGRRKSLDTGRAEEKGRRIEQQYAWERDLAAELRDLQLSYDETRAELRLTPAHIKNVVDVALDLARQPPLAPGSAPDRYRLPPLSGAWAKCADGLDHPYTHAQRELVFDPVLLDRDEVVLCHLGHRLVQMSLRLLRAEVWQPASADRALQRASVRMVDDPRVHEPVLCGHARLVVTGAEGHRVHEELIQAGGFIRDGRLERLGVTALREVMQLPSVGEPRTEIEQRLLALHASLEAPLRAALDARTKDRVDSIRRLVAGRQDEETEKITSVMTELRDRILAELGKTPPPQLALWQDDERDQLERNRHYLQARADRIPAEIERETDALRRRFADPTPRVFPVAVEYLVPRALDRA